MFIKPLYIVHLLPVSPVTNAIITNITAHNYLHLSKVLLRYFEGNQQSIVQSYSSTCIEEKKISSTFKNMLQVVYQEKRMVECHQKVAFT